MVGSQRAQPGVRARASRTFPVLLFYSCAFYGHKGDAHLEQPETRRIDRPPYYWQRKEHNTTFSGLCFIHMCACGTPDSWPRRRCQGRGAEVPPWNASESAFITEPEVPRDPMARGTAGRCSAGHPSRSITACHDLSRHTDSITRSPLPPARPHTSPLPSIPVSMRGERGARCSVLGEMHYV